MPARTFNALSNYMDLLLDAICVVDTDGNFVYVSAGCERIFGYTQQELIGQPMISLVHPDDRQATLQAAADVMEGVKLPHFENRYIRKDGSTAHIMWSARWSEDDRLRIAVARDVTGRKQIEARQQAMYAIAETSYSATDLQDLARKVEPIVQTILPDQGFRIELHQAATHDTSFSCKVKNRSALKAGELALLHFVETQIAIVIERHQLLNRLQHLALYDSLTELPNRQLFHDRMTSAISRAERNGSKLAVFFIDLDNFKAINDTYGHDVGDMTLRQVARRLQTCIRGSDTAARLKVCQARLIPVQLPTRFWLNCHDHSALRIWLLRLRRALASPICRITASTGTRCCDMQIRQCIAQKRTAEAVFMSPDRADNHS